jgi:hypothetical protein
MALQLYRRHTSKCIAKRPRWDRSYRRCKCPIHAEGTLRIDGFVRRGTSEIDWDQAEQVRRKWEAAGTLEWTSLPSPPDEPQADSRISIVAAVTAYLADAKARNLSEATLYKLKIIFEKQFVSWCAHKGYRVLEQVNLDALRVSMANSQIGRNVVVREVLAGRHIAAARPR